MTIARETRAQEVTEQQHRAQLQGYRQQLRSGLRNVYLAPVRHHSPACAWHLRALIRQTKPAVVLIEALSTSSR